MTYEARLAKVCEVLKIQPPAKVTLSDSSINNNAVANNNNNNNTAPPAEPVVTPSPVAFKIPAAVFMKMTIPQLKNELSSRSIIPHRSKMGLRAQLKEIGAVSCEEEKPAQTKKRTRSESK